MEKTDFRDKHNTKLLSNVHPTHWKNPDPASRYNLVVIGAGTAGLVSAAAAAELGGKVALVERHFMGGDCLNSGCVPSKAIIRSSRFYADLRNAGMFGAQDPNQVEPDFPAVMERMRAVRARISQHDSVERFQKLGIDVFLGEARFTNPETVEVAGRRLHFKKAVIATGARPAIPGIQGLEEAGYLTNETVFNLSKRPDRFMVIGGGPLGCELAQAFCRLGCEVTIVQKEPKFLPREERDAAQILTESFERDGIQIRLNTEVVRVTRVNGKKLVHLTSAGSESTIMIDEILVGVGRRPNVEGLHLEAAGVNYDIQEGVLVSDFLRTSNRHIYAAGDVCLKDKFTHMADASARIVIQNALFLARRRLSQVTIPWCTYTDPEIAHVGLYVREARERGIPIKTFTIPLNDVDRAITDAEDDGFIKIHVKEGTDQILGATIVARHAGEMISEISVAIVAKLGLKTIARVIHPYPTQAEGIRKGADAYNRTRLTPWIKKLCMHWLAWSLK